jgi:hypothetical protein
MTPTADSLQGFRNRIINGDMRIDQRNAGAAVTITNAYTLDRWYIREGGTGAINIQQSTTSANGFTNSLVVTVTTTNSTPAAEDRTIISQRIEGYNVADLNWGNANAKSITVSFYVRASVTGTFGGAVLNSAANRSYVFDYTISVADTWEYKTVTIPGDTTGTWEKGNGIGVWLVFSCSSGSTYTATPNSWGSGQFYAPTGQTNLMATNGATWYITGVQLEVGSVATPFERRDYGRELAMCYRYFYKYENTTGGATPLSLWQAYSATGAFGPILTFPVVMRATPTATTSGTFFVYNASAGSTLNVTTFNVDKMTQFSAGSNGNTIASGLVAGNATVLYAPNNGSISFGIEL